MEEVLRLIEIIEDIRQPGKVKHKLLDIVVIVLFAKFRLCKNQIPNLHIVARYVALSKSPLYIVCQNYAK